MAIFYFDHDIGQLHRDDPRQERYNAAIARDIKERGSVRQFPLRGIPASHVDVGALDLQLRKHVEDKEPSHLDLRQRLLQELPGIVQRLKVLQFLWHSDVLEIEFATKDDYGYYGYELSVSLKHLRGVLLPSQCKRDNIVYIASRINNLLCTVETSRSSDGRSGSWDALQGSLGIADGAINQLLSDHAVE